MIRKMISSIRRIYRINYIKTLIINLKFLPIKQAIRFPIIAYGKIKIHSFYGRIIIDAPIKTGMIKLGYRWLDLYPSGYLPTQLLIVGDLIFEGNCVISGGCGLFVQKEAALIQIGNNVTIGAGTLIKSMDQLHIGEFSRITANCTIMNSNMHFVKDIVTGLIQKRSGAIVIGKKCWINSGVVITKGTITPDYSIVARNSFLNKDYTIQGPNAFIAGSPAKIKNNNVQRIFSRNKEIQIINFFNTNPDHEFFQDEKGLFIE